MVFAFVILSEPGTNWLYDPDKKYRAPAEPVIH